VTTIFSVYPSPSSLAQAQFTFTPFKSISYTLHALPTDSRFMGLTDQVSQRILFTNCDDFPKLMNDLASTMSRTDPMPP